MVNLADINLNRNKKKQSTCPFCKARTKMSKLYEMMKLSFIWFVKRHLLTTTTAAAVTAATMANAIATVSIAKPQAQSTEMS